MPYSADLRCSYFRMQFNIDWFYQMMSERNETIEFRPTQRVSGTEDERTEYSRSMFHQHIEDAVYAFMSYKAFGHIIEGSRSDLYENVWECMYEAAHSFDHPEDIIITNTEEDD